MHLNEASIKDQNQWQQAGFILPAFDRHAVCQHTRRAPTWVHFGAGNIFRAFPAMAQQQLLDRGIESTGIIAAEGYDYEIIDLINKPYDNLSLLVTLKADGAVEKTVVGSVVESLKADTDNTADFSRLREIFAAPSLQMASFTITEKGYRLRGTDGRLLPEVEADMRNSPQGARSYMGKLASLCYHRWQQGGHPLALVSMDNCSHNGALLYEAVHAFAEAWTGQNLAEAGFLPWLEDPLKVSFPWSMIDKITPRPDDAVERILQDAGFQDTEGRVTAKGTYVAPFVNAEETQYLVVEDAFPNGRPKLEESGVLFADRDTVEKAERMKVCTCLNPLHTALAIFGCLLGFQRISEEMRDNTLVKLIKRIGYAEGLPVATDPGILSPKAFLDTVIHVRLPNPFMPDTPQRIATDTSQKLPIRFGETIKAYMSSGTLRVDGLTAIPLTLAGWCRYLLGIDDAGNEFTLSPDPMLEHLYPLMAGFSLARQTDIHNALVPLLSDAAVFGVNLYEAGLGTRVEEYFVRMLAGKGAVRQTLEEVMGE